MKLSILVPVYKVEAYIEKCARSLFEQTYKDIEYIFIDDCSPDGSFAVLERVLKDYPERKTQVRIVKHTKNSGLVRARKTGLEAATGELITHCDSDDWVDKDMYEKMVAKFMNPEVDMVFAPMVRNDDEPVKGMWNLEFAGSAADYYKLADKIIAFNSNVNKVYRREVAVRSDIEVPDHIRMAEDMCRTMQTVAHCRRVESITGSFYHYRENPASMSRKFDARAALDNLADVYKVIAGHTDVNLVRPLRVQAARNIAFYGLKLGVFDEAEFRYWWNEMLSLDSKGWGKPLHPKRRLFLQIAGFNFALGRLMVKFLPNNPVDAF